MQKGPLPGGPFCCPFFRTEQPGFAHSRKKLWKTRLGGESGTGAVLASLARNFGFPLRGRRLTARHKKPPSAVPIGNAGGGTSFQRGPTTVVCDQSKPTELAGGCPTIGITLPSSAEAGGLRSAVEHELPKFD